MEPMDQYSYILMFSNDFDAEIYLNKRANSHNNRYGHLKGKHCNIESLIEIYNRHKHYCEMFSIHVPKEQKKLFKRRLQDYMYVLRTGFIRESLDTLVWEDLELLPDNHRMKPPYKISVYTEQDPMEIVNSLNAMFQEDTRAQSDTDSEA